MGNSYTREDSLDSNGRTSRSSSLLRKYSKSFKWRDTEDGGERSEQEGEGEEPPPQLTEEHREVVKRTWRIIEASVAKVGVVLFMGLFETHPDVQEVFTPFRGLPMEQVKQSKELRSHALRVMGFVEKAVRRLDQPEKLEPLIRECGRNHCHYGAQPHQIELVVPQFLQAIRPALEDEWTPEVEEAWCLLMRNVAFGIKTAMLQEMK